MAKSYNNELSSALLKPLKSLTSGPVDFLSKIVLFPKHMEITLKINTANKPLPETSLTEIEKMLSAYKAQIYSSESGLSIALNIKAQYKKLGGKLYIITENGAKIESEIAAQYCHTNDKTFTFIAKSFYWSKQIERGACRTQKDISASDNHSIEYVKKALKQRFLSPKIIDHITSNNHSTQISVESLIQCNHWNWQQQEEVLLSSTQNQPNRSPQIFN